MFLIIGLIVFYIVGAIGSFSLLGWTGTGHGPSWLYKVAIILAFIFMGPLCLALDLYSFIKSKLKK